MLEENNYEIEEVKVNSETVQEFAETYNTNIRTIPQVVINGELIGGFAEVEAKLKGIKSINKI